MGLYSCREDVLCIREDGVTMGLPWILVQGVRLPDVVFRLRLLQVTVLFDGTRGDVELQQTSFRRVPSRWPSGQGVRLESGRSRVRFPLGPGFFRGRVIPVTQKLALQWLSCQAPGVLKLALGLVGPVSLYCDWVR